MDARPLCQQPASWRDAENWLALGGGALLLLLGASRRSTAGSFLAASSVPMLYRGITGRWPGFMHDRPELNSTKTALVSRGAAFAKGLTLKMGQTHMHKYVPQLLERIERGEVDPSFITRTLPGCIARSATSMTAASRSS